MRDAAGQPADGIYFHRLAKLLLGLGLFGNILQRASAAQKFSALTRIYLPDNSDFSFLTVGTDNANIVGIILAVFGVSFDRF